MIMVKVLLAPTPSQWSVDPPSERIPVEEDPNSAPQVIFSPDNRDVKSASHVVSIPDPTPYVFVPDPNEKYLDSTAQSYGIDPSIPKNAPIAPLANNQAPNKKKWIWIVVAAVAFVVIVIAAVVGGVVGSRNAHKDSVSSDTTATAISSSSVQNTTRSSSTTSTSTSTSTTLTNTTSTSTTASPTETNFGATIHMFANDTCGGTDDSFSVLNSNSQKCVVVPSNKRSIQVSQNDGCNVVTWSGSNCAGSSYIVPDTDCHAVLYAAVSVDC
ncbi:hypothetical protein ANOM_000291 [Aspergillus nomiae NRRL 13137]|uniref:Uncharacterized protein n=1 Tax=Aspergillus nomiae NRRL (strain ATCC 15546 / NRRL 13137 / CBS 260.88 / M93) TaxID=1509407 RepID=A0A0L1JIL2_ASPN3|nr:uncharacterized protein ANOM_000291 [Aspergillus nomiae NRRL 13137]KNG91233.1 hypothetical protein ANOM_000291 [Aspergillus nomiae NRRL 13137]